MLVLSEEATDQTVDEIDFKSVLATIAIKRRNPNIYAIVEIIQPKFSLYLQHIEVEEIILNRSSSRALISNIALMSGLNNIFTRFFSMKDGLSLPSILNELKSKRIVIGPSPGERLKYLVICGWKPQLPKMINFIISQYPEHNANWNRISDVANVNNETAKEFAEYFADQTAIELFQGSIVDKDLLKKAGISKATKVIILAETESIKSFEEMDSQTVLAAMMIGSLNKKAYKVAEILDKRYKESLEQANVEEIYLEDEFTRIMLSNGSHGVGITRVISELVNFKNTSFRTRFIEDKFVNSSFKQLVRERGKPGELIIGLLEETGNINVRKFERIQQAQIQSNIRGQVEELIKVKELKPNKVIIAPEPDYVIPPNSQFISLVSSDTEGWKYFQSLQI